MSTGDSRCIVLYSWHRVLLLLRIQLCDSGAFREVHDAIRLFEGNRVFEAAVCNIMALPIRNAQDVLALRNLELFAGTVCWISAGRQSSGDHVKNGCTGPLALQSAFLECHIVLFAGWQSLTSSLPSPRAVAFS